MLAHELYQALFQHADDAIFLIDTTAMVIVAANPAAERMSGYNQEGLCKIPPSQLITPMLINGISVYAGTIRTNHGTKLPVSIGVTDITQTGQPYTFLIVRDIGEQTRQAQSEKLAGMGRLSASIAHEINNPLQALHNTLHLLLSRSFPEEKRERLLAMAQLEVDRLTKIVQRMLELNRPSKEHMRPVSVHGLLESAIAGTASTFEQYHVQVERDWAEQLPWVFGISAHLRQVFLDLAVNAAEAMPEGGRLMIRTRWEQGSHGDAESHVLVEFADNGPGLSDSEVQRIFEPFYTSKSSSTGLGLAISYTIVERHGGTLSVSSGGNGTTFRVTLPVARSNSNA